ncbi:unnamed protein product [Polarella glacialis]|uniref:Uncharacterized protein n=1 Tax=Polarella glacialis TaxID=89957 RepID=A0A813DJM1_POLGL|nr:unnamed protein product [Polarella glacialis]
MPVHPGLEPLQQLLLEHAEIEPTTWSATVRVQISSLGAYLQVEMLEECSRLAAGNIFRKYKHEVVAPAVIRADVAVWQPEAKQQSTWQRYDADAWTISAWAACGVDLRNARA